MNSADSIDHLLEPSQLVSDWGRMEKATVAHIARPNSEDDLCAIVAYARQNQLTLSMRGIGHNTVGQNFVENGIVVDMMAMNKVLELDEQAKTLRVQTGATWAQLTPLLEQKRLTLSTKQEFNIFNGY